MPPVRGVRGAAAFPGMAGTMGEKGRGPPARGGGTPPAPGLPCKWGRKHGARGLLAKGMGQSLLMASRAGMRTALLAG